MIILWLPWPWIERRCRWDDTVDALFPIECSSRFYENGRLLATTSIDILE